MRRALALALALSAATSTVLAEDYHGQGLRPFIGIGYTSGGDTVTSITTTVKGSTTQYSDDLSAGGGLDLRLGLSYRLSGLPLSLQGNWGIHNDQSNGVDGERYSFRRYPVEGQLQWHFSERGSVGFGVRKATRPVLSIVNGSSGDVHLAYNERYNFKSSVGVFIEGEYAVTSYWGLKARYVHENFKLPVEGYGDVKYEGDHIGLLTVFYFN
jgi:opacity protein-like surface antigen